MGSGIKGIKKGGIRDHSLGSGITALGIGISVFSIDSRINIHWDQQNFVGSGIKILSLLGSGIKNLRKNTGSAMKKYTSLRPCKMLKFTSIVGYTSCGPTYIESFLTIFGKCINVLNYNRRYRALKRVSEFRIPTLKAE